MEKKVSTNLTKAQRVALVTNAYKKVFSGSNLKKIQKIRKDFILDYLEGTDGGDSLENLYNRVETLAWEKLKSSPQYPSLSKKTQEALKKEITDIVTKEVNQVKVIV